MQDAARRSAQGQKIAVMFGPERAGLENDDIARANALINVPVNPQFPSLNLAQCVLLTGYEWQRATADFDATGMTMAGTDWADGKDVESLAQHFEDRLTDAGFWYPPHKEASMKVNLRNLWSRLPLTTADVRMLHGVLRQLLRGKTPD